MSLTREQILAIGDVSANSFQLSMSDISWIGENLRLPPEKFVRDLLQRRFTDSRTRFRSLLKLADGCVCIIRKNSYPFSKHEFDSRARQDFLRASKRNSRATFGTFLTLWRGYREADLLGVDGAIDSYRVAVERLLNDAVAENDRAKVAAQGKEGKTRLLHKNGARLAALSDSLALSYRDRHRLREAKLQFTTSLRRDRDILKFLNVKDDDFLWFKFRIAQCDPNHIAFPLRHLVWLPAPAFRTLRARFGRGEPRDQLLEEIGGHIDDDVFDSLRQLYDKIKALLPVDRSAQIEELSRAWGADCMLGTALVGITQVEGLIWDFAGYLRSKRIRIYKLVKGKPNRYYPYKWDFLNSKYRVKYSTGQPKDALSAATGKKPRSLTSARQLLQETKLGVIVDEVVFSYLVDEFYDDRNSLAHGDLKNRNMRADAVGAVLCVRTCLELLVAHLKADFASS